MKRKILIILIGIFGCSEPFKFDTEVQETLVVDAKVSTVSGNSYIDIYSLNGSGKASQSDLSVRVFSTNGAEMSFAYDETSARYIPSDPSFFAIVGYGYRFEAESGNGTMLSSDFDYVPAPVDFSIAVKDTVETFLSDLNRVFNRRARAAVASIPVQEDPFYVKFEFEYEYEDYFSRELVKVDGEDEYVLSTNVDNAFSQDILNLPIGSTNLTEWRFYDDSRPPIECQESLMCGEDPCCGNPCCYYTPDWPVNFIIVQEALSREAYEFWENAERLRNNNGLVFDTYPFPLEGNITCEGCDGQLAGLFRAVSEIQKKQRTTL
ncbi:MAG: hypothetical protein Tsb0034_05320 [Ekhidna sp.]